MDAEQRIAELEAALADRDSALANREAEIARLRKELEALRETVEELKAKLSQNSRNSHLPPSTDPPGRRKGKGKNKPKRKRGGQKGHRGSKRELLPEDQVDEFVDLYPDECENCWASLPEIQDPAPKRHQVTEIPRPEPHTTEFRRHAVCCPDCNHQTRAKFDAVTMGSPFGPRLTSVIALLTGVYHLSRRKTVTVLSDLLGVQVSLGGVSNVEARVSSAIEPAVQEAWDRVDLAPVKNTDGTSWKQAGTPLQIWTIATTIATVFKIVVDGSAKTLRPLFGELHGILISDRATALHFWAIERRQVCWAHLLRKFIYFSERNGSAAGFGRDLLGYTGLLFEYWHAYKDGRLSRRQLRKLMQPVRIQVEALLEKAVAADIKNLSGSCADILLHRKALWTFLDENGVEPTNNEAEREVRSFVLWRKRSFGTQSERGNLFAERIMTIAHTARKQGRDVLAFLTEACDARRTGKRAPSLFGLPAG